MLNRNLIILFCSQVIFVTGTVVLVTIGGIAGSGMAPDPNWATLPVAFMVVGTALSTVPTSLLMQHIGRRNGFCVGVLIAVAGALLASYALETSSFALFCGATIMIGASIAFSQQFRFAAAENVTPDRVSYAVSFILLGSIIGAILSPIIVNYAAGADAQSPFRLAFRVMAGVYLIAGALLYFLQQTVVDEVSDDTTSSGRPWRQLVGQPVFITAVLAGVVGQGLMTYVMTATPISMSVTDGFSIQDTSSVVRSHVIAMYLPALFTPFLIDRFGLHRIMLAGIVVFAITLGVGLLGHHYLHYSASMILLGVGWNFLFVSGTTMLTQAYAPEERFRAQATNDFCVFSGSACASLLAGTVMHTFGWESMLISGIPFLLLMLAVMVWQRRVTQRRAQAV